MTSPLDQNLRKVRCVGTAIRTLINENVSLQASICHTWWTDYLGEITIFTIHYLAISPFFATFPV